MATPRSRVVFVGNIPYEMSEEQLITIFSEVGPVAGFRLVFDRDTGKPKGYGFCEFHDPETAASAVRNLNDVDVGGRSLRIDWADVDPVFQGRTTQMGQIDGELPKRDGRRPGNPSAGGPQRGGGGAGAGPPFGQQGGPGGFGGPPQQGGFGGPGGYGGPPQGGFGGPPQGGFGGAPAGMDAPYNLNNLPPGVNLQAGQTATDAITQTLATLPPDQLLDIMGQIKSLILTSPQSAQNLLSSHPQLTYALFQAMLMMNLVDPAILQRILLAGGVNGGAAAAAVANGGPAVNGAAGGMGQQQRYPSMGGGPPPPQQQQPYGGGAYGANPYSNTPPPGAPPSRPPFGQPSHLGRASSAQSTPPPPPPSAPPIAPPQANAAAAAAAAVAAGGGGAAAAANNPNLPDAQRQLLMQVLGLSDAQVAALPPDQRESIMMLRRQMGK